MSPENKPLALVVDDEEAFLEIASVRLEAAGMSVVVAHTVDEAIKKAEELLPDIVLSDISMPPGPNGWELAFALRRNEKTRETKFAFFTSLRNPWSEFYGDPKAAASELGPIVSLNKTLDVEMLADRVWKILKS